MKRFALLLGISALMLPGCVDPTIIGFHPAPPPEASKVARVQRPPIVSPDQVNESNAYAMAQALQAEMEFDAPHDETKSAVR